MIDQPEMIWLRDVPYVRLKEFHRMHAERNEAREAANEQVDKLRAERDEARAAARRVYGYLDMRLCGNSLIRHDLLKQLPWLREVSDEQEPNSNDDCDSNR